MIFERPHFFLAAAIGLFSFAAPCEIQAQDTGVGEEPLTEEEQEVKYQEYLKKFPWQVGGEAALGDIASVYLGNDYHFLGGDDALNLLQNFGNLISEAPEGLVGPEGLDWFLVFSFEDSGYVPDDEQDDLNPDKLLSELRENQKYSNKQRAERGMPTSTYTGWEKEPFYNPETNNLEWAIKFRTEGAERETVNYKTKLLGRSGVMDVVLVCAPDQLDSVLPEYQTLVGDVEFNSGLKYAEYKDGDKLAEYGLTALVVGGAAAVGAKLGLFAWLAVAFKKFGKFIIIGLLGIGAMFKKVFVGNKGQ